MNKSCWKETLLHNLIFFLLSYVKSINYNEREKTDTRQPRVLLCWLLTEGYATTLVKCLEKYLLIANLVSRML